MSEDTKFKVVPDAQEKVGNPDPTSIFDDLASLRKKSKLTVVRKPVLINVDVGRPPNNVYFRANPNPDMMLDDATILRDVEGAKKTTYYVTPAMRSHVKLAPRLRHVTIALVTTWPTSDIILWPVPILGDSDLKAWKSARTAFEWAQKEWVMMVWSSDKGDYQVEIAEEIKKDPVWPEKTFSEILKIGLADKVIDNEDHPYVRRLRGVIN